MTKRPRLFIHIGHPKTGTTSIQSFLSENREKLLRQGIFVPLSGMIEGAHHGLARNWYAIRNREDLSAECRGKFHDEVKKGGCRTVVVSSEGFLQEKPSKLAELSGGNMDVFIIYYIRRQDLAVESVYAQRIRSYITMSMAPPESMFRLIPDYRSVIRRFSLELGKESMIVRPFEKEAFHDGSLLSDFMHIIGANHAEFNQPERKKNQALKKHYLEYKRSCNRLPLLQHEHDALNKELARLSSLDDSPEAKCLIPESDRNKILEMCAEANSEIAREYLARSDGFLFSVSSRNSEMDARRFGDIPPEVQHSITERLAPSVRMTLEFLDEKIRRRLPGESFMEDPPSDIENLRKAVKKREMLKLKRRVTALEERSETNTGRTKSRPGLKAKLLVFLRKCFSRK